MQIKINDDIHTTAILVDPANGLPYSAKGTGESSSSGTTGIDTNGNPLPLEFDYLPQVFNYDNENKLISIVKNQSLNNWTQTYSYTGANLTGISGWVKNN